MKTKQLIELLQKFDPSGEKLVTLGGAAVQTVELLPEYYDGSKMELVGTYGEHGIYDVQKVRLYRRTDETAVVIHMRDLEDVIWDNPEIEIEYVGNEQSFDYIKAFVEETRNKVREFENTHTIKEL